MGTRLDRSAISKNGDRPRVRAEPVPILFVRAEPVPILLTHLALGIEQPGEEDLLVAAINDAEQKPIASFTQRDIDGRLVRGGAAVAGAALVDTLAVQPHLNRVTCTHL